MTFLSASNVSCVSTKKASSRTDTIRSNGVKMFRNNRFLSGGRDFCNICIKFAGVSELSPGNRAFNVIPRYQAQEGGTRPTVAH